VRTKAEPQADGSLRVTGGKIFISGGDHDLTDNIVHLVLCRLPDAPARHQGPVAGPGAQVAARRPAQHLFCDGIEHKMGIHGSATCQMRYDGADRLAGRRAAPRPGGDVPDDERGPPARGPAGPGPPGDGDAERLRYASERLQMRAARRPEGASAAPADPIAWHPAMRRTLLTLQARTDGCACWPTAARCCWTNPSSTPTPAPPQPPPATWRC
jgi:alkylation response protein AidB-like acyl-CoA dehydrogenase